jgi:hypothetical protein
MTATLNHEQRRSEHGWGGDPKLAAGCRAHTSAAHDKAQNGRRVPFVGVSRCSPRGLTHSSPVRTGAGLNRSRLFSLRSE